MTHEDWARDQVVQAGWMEKERRGEPEPTVAERNTAHDSIYNRPARLNRGGVKYKSHGNGLYATSDGKHGIQKLGKKNWAAGVHQPYHFGSGSSRDDYDFHSAPSSFRSLREAQEHIEKNEAEMPRRAVQDLPFHDRRGL